jgi:hypothetical protein
MDSTKRAQRFFPYYMPVGEVKDILRETEENKMALMEAEQIGLNLVLVFHDMIEDTYDLVSPTTILDRACATCGTCDYWRAYNKEEPRVGFCACPDMDTYYVKADQYKLPAGHARIEPDDEDDLAVDQAELIFETDRDFGCNMYRPRRERK